MDNNKLKTILYWTEERKKNATPIPIPVISPKNEKVNNKKDNTQIDKEINNNGKQYE